MEKQKNSVGRRKEAITRVFINKGNGNITVNDKNYKEYFTLVYLQNQIEAPLKAVEGLDKFDIKITANGGGIKGQAEAARMAISRALCEFDAEHRGPLKKEGFLTRDPRMVERKKPGRRKARRRFQFSKR